MTFVAEDLSTLLNTYTYAMLTHGGYTGTFQKWESITDTGDGVGVVVEINTSTLMIYVTSGTFEPGVVTGGTSTAEATISAIGLSQPSIRLIYQNHPNSHPSDGEVIINEEQRTSSDNGQNRRTETYRTRVEINFDGQTNPELLNRLLRQVQHSFDAENRKAIASRTLSTKDYFWSLLYNWAGLTRLGQVILFVDCSKRWIPI